MGASRGEILAMFNRRYVMLVAVCFVLAVPVSIWAVRHWLAGFAYAVPLYWWVFALALAGVLALNPEILIFDEATSMLDPKGRREVLAEMKKLRDCGKTVVMITHDVEEAALADRVILMGCPNGQKDPNTVLAQGSVREILTDSRLLIQAGIVPPMAVRMYEDLKLAGID